MDWWCARVSGVLEFYVVFRWFRRAHFLCCFMLCYHRFIPSDCYFNAYCVIYWHVILTPDTWHLISDTGIWHVDTWYLTLVFDMLTLDIWHRYLTCYHSTPDTWHLTLVFDMLTPDTWYLTLNIWHRYLTCYHLTPDTWQLTCYHLIFNICYHLILAHLTWFVTPDWILLYLAPILHCIFMIITFTGT